jgi:hypothetical protein
MAQFLPTLGFLGGVAHVVLLGFSPQVSDVVMVNAQDEALSGHTGQGEALSGHHGTE